MLAVLVQVRSTQHAINTMDARQFLLFALKLFNLQDMVLPDDGGRAWPACFGQVVLVVSDSVEVSLILDRANGTLRGLVLAVIVLGFVSDMPLGHSHVKT